MLFNPDSTFSLYLRYGIKVGIAAGLAYVISYFLASPYAIWAVVSAVVAMQLNVADSLQTGLVRFSGTALGAVIGVGLLLATPQTPLFYGSAVVLAAVCCGYLLRYTPLAGPMTIAAIVVLLSGAQHLPAGHQEAISFGLMRVVEIAIGVGSAFLVSLVLWPVRLMDTLRTDLGLQFRESARLLDTLLTAFLNRQTALPYEILSSIENKIWDNHERLSRARKHESFLFHYEHHVMSTQVKALDRTAESLRSMLEALNDYDEEGIDPLTGPEQRVLGDAIMATLRHLGGEKLDMPAPDLVRGLTGGVAGMEARLVELRQNGTMRSLGLHKVLQIFSFYQAMRLLAESLLIALDRLQTKKR